MRDHWLGRQSLTLSFWVNLALLRTAILSVEGFILTPRVDGAPAGVVAAILFFIVAHVIIYAWQLVGVVRACDRYQSSCGPVSVAWAVNFGILVSLIFTFASVFTTAQNTLVERKTDLLSVLWEQERASRYALTLSGDRIYLTGSFELGITEKLRTLLEQHPDVKGIVLASPGGNTFAGRGVASVIRNHDLDSYVFEDCFSACTLGFIAGATRTLGPRGKLGFHQYGLDADYPAPFADSVAEQNLDREFFRSQKISDAFLEKVFEASRSDLWIPDTGELLEAGVIHGVAAKFIEE